MADNIPQINDARRLGKQYDLRRCVIVFETNDGQYGFSSYGRTRSLCQSTGDIMDSVHKEIGQRFAEANRSGS